MADLLRSARELCPPAAPSDRSRDELVLSKLSLVFQVGKPCPSQGTPSGKVAAATFPCPEKRKYHAKAQPILQRRGWQAPHRPQRFRLAGRHSNCSRYHGRTGR